MAEQEVITNVSISHNQKRRRNNTIGEIEKLRTVSNDDGTTLIVFHVIETGDLSCYKFIFSDGEQERIIPFPNISANKGDFIWLTDMEHETIVRKKSEPMNHIDVSEDENSSKTRTFILFIPNPIGIVSHFNRISL